ncbi:hypothetical protein [Falsibacillus albus]|uniref:DUF2326 domain-containing protein n=1 Tax=Falsibacillus albus TaxID=2478915 RepID=A0A3L7JGU3_9BACI|nr:hypothetical protein [Falsibacillus albus]RLQ89998.1 hypothetical protein D9X91_21945 [Falsibacillus albus]
MYLKRMRMNEGVGEEKEIRNVPFKAGINIIVDETGDTDNSQGNNVGKTTFLKLIDICFGAKDKKYIWTDNDTGSETTSLKNYINDKKVYVELEIIKGTLIYSLKVELFERGKRYINGEHFTYDNYVDRLNELIFNIEKPPSFRQLIGKFIRIKQKEDTNTFLKYLHQNTTNAEYKNIYDFLFKLSSHEDSERKLKLHKEIEQIKKDISQLIKIHKFSNIDDLRERIRIVQNSVRELEQKVKSMIYVEDYEKNLERISSIKELINTINDSIASLLFKRAKITNILGKEEREEVTFDESVLLEFYKDVERSLGSISKDFNELVEFNKSIRQNKIKYYKNRLEKVDIDLEKMERARASIVRENKNIISIIEEGNFKEFENVHKQLIEQSEQLGLLSKIQDLYNDLIDQLVEKSEKYEAMNGNSESFDNLSNFNEYLTNYSNEIFGQRLYLTRENSFPLKLSNVDEGLGTGYRKTITLLLDIAYVSFLKELDLEYPKFFVHDVLETVDEHNLSKIVEFINENDSQFVFAMLNEKIKDYSFIDEDDKILRLSKDNKLFKI